jgi:hypothetical protein
LPVHRSNRYADERLTGETSYLKVTAIVAAMMIAPATTATATEWFIWQICACGGPVQAGLTHYRRASLRCVAGPLSRRPAFNAVTVDKGTEAGPALTQKRGMDSPAPFRFTDTVARGRTHGRPS